jgi:hypothetical protein
VFRPTLVTLALAAGPAAAGPTDDIAALATAPSRPAWDRVAAAGPNALLPLLRAWPADDPVAANWLGLAFAHIAAGHKNQLPAADLTAFATDPKNPGPARRLALEAVEAVTPGATAGLLRGWLGDPEFGPDAVAARVAAAETAADGEAMAILKDAYAGATDFDQVQLVTKKLAAHGVAADPLGKLGVVRAWAVVGPFDADCEAGLKASFPPEASVDLAATYPGRGGAALRWRPGVEAGPDGRADLLRADVSPKNGAVAYAAAVLTVPAAGRAELRVGAVDNVTAWVNGSKVVSVGSTYRSHFRADRHRAGVDLKAGDNLLLLKLTKTPPTTEGPAARGGPPEKWEFMARLVDDRGRAVPFAAAGGKP